MSTTPNFENRVDKFGTNKQFSRILWGERSVPLDIELTELQKIINNQIALLGNTVLDDGFVLRPALGYSAGVLTVPPAALIVAGNALSFQDPMTISGVAGTTVYLACGEAVIKYTDAIKRDGNLSGGQAVTDNGIYDSATGFETSRRVQRQLQLTTNNTDPSKTYLPVASISAGGTVTDNRVRVGLSSALITSLSSATAPVMNGTSAAGVASTFSKSDHVHPTDTSRAPVDNPTFTGAVKAPVFTSDELVVGSRFEKHVGLFVVANGSTNQKIDLLFDNLDFSGYLDITIAGGYNFSNAAGQVTKRLSMRLSKGGSINSQHTEYKEVLGPIAGQIAISDISWDATRSKWRVQIASLNANGNSFTVHVAGQTNSVDSTFSKSSGLSAVYTTDVTVFPAPLKTFTRQVSFAVVTGTAPFTVTSTTAVPNLNADMVDSMHAEANASTASTIAARNISGNIVATRFISDIATGTAPLQVNSTTVVPYLNVDTVDGFHLDQDIRTTASPTFTGLTTTGAAFLGGGVGNSLPVVRIVGAAGGAYIQAVDAARTGSSTLWLTGVNGAATTIKTLYNTLDDGTGNATFGTVRSNVATGTAPFTVASTTAVPNLNADMVDGFHLDQDVRKVGNPTFASVTVAATSAAPFVINSTTLVPKLNADMVDGFHMDQSLTKLDRPTFAKMTLTATGEAPISVSSNVVVTNLNADMVDGKHATDFQPVEATTFTNNTTYIAVRTPTRTAAMYYEFYDGVGWADIHANRFVSKVATGTAPFTVTSTTVVPNLNADMVDGFQLNQDVQTTASPTFAKVTAGTFASTQATGTAPFTVTSTTMVPNLNADTVDGFHASTTSGANSIVAQDANGDITVRRVISNVAVGTAPFGVTSTTVVPNLNADMVDGFQASTTSGANSIVVQDANQDITVRRFISNVAVGTAPFTVTSTTLVTNLNADMVDGYHATMLDTINTVMVRDASGNAVSKGFISTIPHGTAPFGVTSATMVVNLNAEFISGKRVTASAASPSGGADGDIWIQY